MVDRIWFAIDHSTPSWDQAEYLTGALNYWRALQTPQWFSADWWTGLWQLSSKIPPLVYISTAPFLTLFGTGPDQSTLINLLYSAILLGSVYTLGTFLFNISVGLWAAGLCLLLPGLYRVRLDYLLDYPLAAMVTLSFTCLTIWRGRAEGREKGEGDRRMRGQGDAETRGHGDTRAESGKGREDEGDGEDGGESPFPTPHFPLSIPQFKIQNSKFKILPSSSWLLAIALGLTFGLALMVKQPALLFLLVPLVAAAVETLWNRRWLRLAQLAMALTVSLLVWWPWYRTNWLLVLTAGKRATVDSAIAEGDPSLLSLDAWTFYLKVLPLMVSSPLLLVGLAGIVLFWRRSRVSSRWFDKPDYAPMKRDYRQQIYVASQRSLSWLLLFCVGGYLFSSLNINKDERYVVPYLPTIAVILAYGFTLFPRHWRGLTWGAVGLSSVLMISNLFPMQLTNTAVLRNPVAYHPAYLGSEYPYSKVVAEVIQTEPYLRSTIGVLPSTAEVNQHNLNYYGNLKNFQVYGRQVGTRLKQVQQDGRSLSWFITKTGNQGSIRKQEAHNAIVQRVEQGGDFQLHATWAIPDGSMLKLFRRQIPLLKVEPSIEREEGRQESGVRRGQGAEEDTGTRGHGDTEIKAEGRGQKAEGSIQSSVLSPQSLASTQNSKLKTQNSSPTPHSLLPTPHSKIQNSSPTPHTPHPTPPIRLEQMILPPKAPPGKPIPVTYRWSGSWDALQSGLVLLTWRSQKNLSVQGSTRWLHDHGIGMGSLQLDGGKTLSASPRPRVSPSPASPSSPPFQVTERMAMQPPTDLAAGIYTLEAIYLNRKTGETSTIAVPPVRLQIDPAATPTVAPELDWLTQLRSLAAALPQGIKGLNLAFDEIGRLNQYDPVQDYITQTRQAMEYRLQQEPENRDFAYALALANVLKRRVNPAIAAMQKVTQVDPRNPNAYAYLAFVNLYDFRPQAAQTALNTALKLNPNLPELHALSGVAALMRGNLPQAWQNAQAYQRLQKKVGSEGVKRSGIGGR
nr:phospholipid carrier-dependent glycosyltransferase [Kovacikia minuta]